MSNRARKINPARAMPRAVLALSELRAFLDKIIEEDGCWVWTGYTDRKGYGQVKHRGRAVWAHRLSYAHFKRGLRDGDHVDHVCKNPSCVNPNHLRRVPMSEHYRRTNQERACDVPF